MFAMLRSAKSRALVLRMPKERVLTETDGPFVHDGDGPATPITIRTTVTSLGELWGQASEDVQARILGTSEDVQARILGNFKCLLEHKPDRTHHCRCRITCGAVPVTRSISAFPVPARCSSCAEPSNRCTPCIRG